MAGREAVVLGVLEEFLPGYLGGGTARLGTPLGRREVDGLAEHIAAGRAPERVASLRRSLSGELAAPGDDLPLEADEAPLLAVVYNLLAISHPAPARLDARPFGREAATAFTSDLARSLAPPRTSEEALAAHSLVSPLFRAVRRDTEVSFWAGHLHFAGRAPPSHVTRWQRLRRVQTTERVLPALATFLGDAQWRILDRLVLASPLTDLCTADRPAPPFTFGATARWLADPELCRGIVYQWVRAADPAVLGGILVASLLVRARGTATAEELLLLVHALYHFHLMLLLESHYRGEPLPVAGAPDFVASGTDALRHLAFLAAARRVPEDLELPGDDAWPAHLRERLAAADAALRPVPTEAFEDEILRVLGARLGFTVEAPRSGDEVPTEPGVVLTDTGEIPTEV